MIDNSNRSWIVIEKVNDYYQVKMILADMDAVINTYFIQDLNEVMRYLARHFNDTKFMERHRDILDTYPH